MKCPQCGRRYLRELRLEKDRHLLRRMSIREGEIACTEWDADQMTLWIHGDETQLNDLIEGNIK